MANRRENQFHFSLIPRLTSRIARIDIGASGVPTISNTNGTSNGVKAVTKLATGIYQVELDDSFNEFMIGHYSLEAGVTGGSVAIGSLSAGSPYQILTVGTTVWSTVGLPAGVTAIVGAPFVATGTGTGTGTAKLMTTSGVCTVETLRVANSQLSNTGGGIFGQGPGAYFLFQTLDFAGALVQPTSGCKICFEYMLRNSVLVS